MDIWGTHQTPILVLTNIVLLLWFYFMLKPSLRNANSITSKKVFVIEFIILVFCLFSFWGTDWYGYLSYFELVKSGYYEHVPIERVYLWLMEVLPSYVLFRLVVWGLGLFLTIKAVKNFHINKGLFLFFFCCISLIWFSYARASLAMAFLFCGVSYFAKENPHYSKLLFNKLIGLALLVVSFYFHKSAAIGLAGIVLAIFLSKIGAKWGLRLLIITFPLLLVLVKGSFIGIIDGLTADESNLLNEYAVSGSVHLDSNASIKGIGIIIEQVLERIPSYLMVIICFKALLNKVEMPRGIELIMYSMCSLVFAASIFAFDLGANTQTIYGRMMRYTQIPLCICLTYCYEQGLSPKLVKWTYTIGIVGCAYTISYMLYNVIIG